MTSETVAASPPGSQQAREPLDWLRARWTQAQRFNPSQGWITYVLLAVTLSVVGTTISRAEWTETPGLIQIMVWSSLAGLLLAKVRAPWPLLHLAGLAIGFVVVVWQAATLVHDQSLPSQVQEVWHRLYAWYEAMASDGINRDLLPFTMGLLTTAWLLGYFGSWFIFRRNNVWVAVVLSGVALLTHLSFLPDVLSLNFFIFAFFAMLLIVRVRIVQRQEQWREAGIQFSPVTGWLTLHSTMWFSAAVLLVAALLPMNVYVSRTVVDAWNIGRAPIGNLEEGFARVFSGISSRKDLSGRYFGKTLPFLGPIHFGGEVVFWASSDYPSYWLSQTYSRYTSEGWIAADTQKLEVGPDSLPPPPQGSLDRIPVDQSLHLNFGTDSLFSGGDLSWIDRGAVVETLAPMRFEIDLRNPTKDANFPADIQDLAQEMRESLGSLPQDQFVESTISRSLPEDLVLTSLIFKGLPTEDAPISKVTVTRKDSIVPEIVSYKFSGTLPEDDTYSMVSYVSVATDDELQEAGTDYPSQVKDHYLQLPADLPQRIRDLALDLTREASAPLEKARAIEQYLRGPAFEYSQEIEAPPLGADGVDHFLFETQTGYSDYFASSMTVLLRAAGVPSRLAAGYAPGEYDPEVDARAVRDSDSHGWVQVYFPRYGWIDFEPTPNWPEHERVIGAAAGTAEGVGDLELPELEAQDEEFMFPAQLQEIGLGSPGGFFGRPVAGVPGGVWLGLVIAAIVLAAGLAMGWAAWNLDLARTRPVEQTYTKMGRLGAIAGIGYMAHQTPIGYATTLGNAIPAIAPAVRAVAGTFASAQYGQRELDEADEQGLRQAWKQVRGGLVVKALKRLIPFRSAD